MLTGCAKAPEHKEAKNLVLVSVEPYVDVVQALCGDTVQVKCVLPPHVDPHNWEPKLTDLSGYDHASIWFTIGEGFESSLRKVLPTDLQIISLAEGVETLHAACNCGIDTHFWLDPLTLAKQAERIATTLHVSPKEFVAKLKKQDQALKKALKPAQGKIMVTSHGAFTYFCHRYKIEQFVIEPEEGKEPLPKYLTQLATTLRKEKERILGIFTQPQHSNKAATILSNDLHIPMYEVDPYKKNVFETWMELEKDLTRD